MGSKPSAGKAVSEAGVEAGKDFRWLREPLHAAGSVVKGFGRGSKELGIPTANIPIESVDPKVMDALDSGIYFGLASLHGSVYSMVMSVGWNPYYKNKTKTLEAHLLHGFDNDFYGEDMRLSVLAYIRPEADFQGVEQLVKEINNDIRIARHALASPQGAALRESEAGFLTSVDDNKSSDNKDA